jgi:hypothetical protein
LGEALEVLDACRLHLFSGHSLLLYSLVCFFNLFLYFSTIYTSGYSPVITDLMCRLSLTYQIDKMEEP